MPSRCIRSAQAGQQDEGAVVRAPEVQDDSFGGAIRGVMLLDRIQQLIPAKLGGLRPEVAARHDDNRPHQCRIHHLTQCIIGVQANDKIVIARHVGPVILRAARNPTKNPATRIHNVAINVMPLPENTGKHSLSTGNVSGASGLWESGGSEISYNLEPPLVTMKAMCRHRQTTNPDTFTWAGSTGAGRRGRC